MKIKSLLSTLAFGTSIAVMGAFADVKIGERPAVEMHMSQGEIENGNIEFKKIVSHGRTVFEAQFNEWDGQGRPSSTGGGAARDPHGQPAFFRTSGPDSNSCVGCHNQPAAGGAGDFVANVFVLAQMLDPVTESISPNFSNERNTLGMFGAGAIEKLAIEMSKELIEIRNQATNKAKHKGEFVTLPLVAKEVSFGSITVSPTGLVDPSDIQGVDWDLIIKPFHQKGAVVSLREFTNNAMNHHHGIQTVERFGEGADPDGDGVVNELSIGDVTAAAVFQASLPVPQQKLPKNQVRRAAARDGEKIFSDVGCASCHVTEFKLNDRHFVEPNPFNPVGNHRVLDLSQTLTWDMTVDGQNGNKLERHGNGAIVRPFTDLKRHNLCDEEFNHFCNEKLNQGSLVGFANPSDFLIPAQPRSKDEFITRKLWDVADSSPYGHRGDLTSITKAIYYHGGEAREMRDFFFSMSQENQDKVIEFLRTLGVFSD